MSGPLATRSYRGIPQNYWVRRFTLLIDAARPCRHAAGDRWLVDKTHVKVDGRCVYLYQVIDPHGQVIDVLVALKRDLAAAR